MVFEKSLNFKSEYVINFTKDNKSINHALKRSCKVLQFSSTFTLENILLKISRLNSKDYPFLFLFVIETEDFDNFEFAKIKECDFDAKRPIILQITSENGSKTKWIYRKENVNQFIDLDDDHDFEQLSTLLRNVSQAKVKNYKKLVSKVIERFSSLSDSSTILRFLSALNVFDEFSEKLITLCALEGKKTDILAVLDASFEDDGRILSVDAQNILSNTFTVDNEETSILIQAIHNPNKEVIDYLISNCTHLIQQLPFAHRIIVSTTAQDLNKFGILNDLIKCSDFPYPNNFDESSVTDNKLLQTITERKEFLNAIRDKDENRVEKFTNENWNLKLVFSTENKSALYVAAESKNFDAYVKLKSLGFKAEEFETHNDITYLSKNERKELDKKIWSQTQKNAADAKLDHEKTVHILRTRSYIHNRMTSKDVEAGYREKIRNIFDTIYKIPLCSKFLDAASQCEDLKIIFDFESESVENVDLKSGPSSSGTTYPKSKLIFIGAKDSDENPKRAIEGVLIHEIGHYVMRLVYENNEKPYYKNDMLTENEFDQICKTINKWPKIKGSESNDKAISFEKLDENDNKPVDDECNGIISSVYTHYNEADFHPELIVRPLQILAHYNGDETKTNSLKFKYNQLFDYIDNNVVPDLNNFNLRNRESIRKINRTIGIWSRIEKEKLHLENIKSNEELMQNKLFGIAANIPLLALASLFQIAQNDNLPDATNIFISSETCQNEEILENIKSVLKKSKDIRLITDCSIGFKQDIKKLIDMNLKTIVFVINKDQRAELEELMGSKIETIKEVDYIFEDLTDESQFYIFQKEIIFQDDQKVRISDLLGESKDKIDQYKNLIDDKLLKMLTENSKVSINIDSKDEIYDRNFEILYQPRKLIKTIKNSDTENARVISQEEILSNVKGMKSILISDLGGTGKSWMLKQIARSMRAQNSRCWVTYIDLKLHVMKFENQKVITEFSKFMTENVLGFKNDFEMKIFNLLYTNGRVVFLFDGFDEIPQECADVVTRLIKSFEHNRGNQLWTATRNYCENDLQQKLKFDAVFKLEDFTEENGMDLIVQTWLLNEKSLSRVEINIKADLKLDPNYPKYKKIAKKLELKLPKQTGRPIGFPLFYNMIANVYTNKIDSIDILTMFLIFDAFVKQQYKRLMCEKGETGAEAVVKTQNKNCGYFEIHQLLALRSLFPKKRKFCNLDYGEHNWFDKEINACGIATKNGEICFFQHECFREFFVVQYILMILIDKTQQINQDFWEILKDILSKYKFVVLRMFLNDALAQGTETYNKVKETLASSENYSKNLKSEEVLMRICKESHANLICLLIELSPKEDYKIVKDTLNQTIERIIEVAESNDTIFKIFEVLKDFLIREDLKELILDREVFQSIIELRPDITLLDDISKMLQSKIDKTFVKDCLKLKSYADRNAFYFLCKSEYFNANNFKILISLLQKYLNPIDIVEMIKKCDDSEKNILHICIEMMNKEKLIILWNEIKKVCDDLNLFLNFKELIIQKESSVLHVATSSDNVDFHDTLWKLLLETYPKTSELKDLVKSKDKNGFSFFHLLIKSNNYNLLKQSFKNTAKIPFKDILKIKDDSGRNLLHFSICTCKKDSGVHEVLWNILKTSITSYNEIIEILKDIDNEKNDIIQLVMRYSTNNVFDFVLRTLTEMISSEDIKIILKKLNQAEQNLIQIAVINNLNADLEFYKRLWNNMNKYLERNEILDIINSTDKSGNNVLFSAVLYSKKSIVELIWVEIRKFVCEKAEQKKYLNVIQLEEKSLLDLSKMNVENPEVAIWVDKLLKEFLPKELTNDHPYGKSENLLRFEEDNQITNESEKLQQILEHPDVCDRKIVAFSVIGAFRKGKSFFLNYCLRFLYAHFSSINYPENPISNKDKWMGESSEPLIGFSWRSGSTRDTMGITIWNDVFLHTDENGDKLAIIVLDTQGLFDNDTSPQDNSRIFAIGTLISSIQVFNISMQVQEDQLQYLQFATDYAKFASNDGQQENGKCFQNLTFLIRDWPHPDEYDYGVEEGKKYLQNFLKIKDNQNDELKSVRKYIHNSFDKLDCILLPPPGNNVAIGRRKGMKYDGNHGEMDGIFRTNLFEIVEYLFSAEKLIGKKIHGKCLTGVGYFQYVEKYFKIFKSQEFPKTQSIYEITVEQQLYTVMKSCIEEYQKNIEKNQKIINRIEQIEIIHQHGKLQAFFKYFESKKMGNNEYHDKFKGFLLTQIDEDFENWSEELIKKITSELKLKEIENQKEAASKIELKKELEDNLTKSLNTKTEEIKTLKIELENVQKEKSTDLELLNVIINELKETNLKQKSENEIFKVKIQQKDAEISSLNETINQMNDKYVNEKLQLKGIKKKLIQRFQNSETITVAIFDESNKLVVQEELLKNMLLHPEVKYRKIVILSIPGAYSKGKSFFLNYCLRFLYYHYSSIKHPGGPIKNSTEWIGAKYASLQGFPWQLDTSHDTNRFVFWNDVFLQTDKATGDDLAIIVMDTQGVFDKKSTSISNSRIFSLGTLISSILVFNFSNRIHENELKCLQFASDFTKCAADHAEKNFENPFQNLMFLIRDWYNSNDYKYGLKRGQTYLDEVLLIDENQKEEIKDIRKNLKDAFKQLACCLVPHPGDRVSSRKKRNHYDGNWGEMYDDFKEEIVKVIEHLLKPESLVPKMINGREINGKEFFNYCLKCFELFESDELPNTQNVYESLKKF